MKNLLIDTCVLIHIIRGKETANSCIKAIEQFDSQSNIIISVVSYAEIESFAIQHHWGATKMQTVKNQLNRVTCIDINPSDTDLLAAYAQIDAYSNKKGMDKRGDSLLGAARRMGKNDLWIAATAYALDIPLMTTDNDFDHLNRSFLSLIKIP